MERNQGAARQKETKKKATGLRTGQGDHPRKKRPERTRNQQKSKRALTKGERGQRQGWETGRDQWSVRGGAEMLITVFYMYSIAHHAILIFFFLAI